MVILRSCLPVTMALKGDFSVTTPALPSSFPSDDPKIRGAFEAPPCWREWHLQVTGFKGAIFHCTEAKVEALGVPQETSTGLGLGF